MISTSLAETQKIAKELISTLKPHSSGARILALSGDLGSGKTTFAKAVASELGISSEEVTSPTFVIMKNYDVGGRNHFKKLIHIDAYRLEKKVEIERLGWKELVSDYENLIVIEWPEHIKEAMPRDTTLIEFQFIDENTREIRVR
jgi:tRNA threonylcarbamoyladenosine biosynthesis protein TsaE